jgi:hypothetical protein
VTGVSVDGSGVTVNGALVIAPNGSSIDVPLLVTPSATQGVRALVLTTSSGDVRFGNINR